MELPYIFLPPDKLGVNPKGLGQPTGRGTPIKYNEETIEQNYENAVLEFSDTDVDNSQFIFIELNDLSPWNSKVKEMLKKLNLELIKVFSPKIIIVKIAPKDIPQFKEKIKEKHKYIKETVKNLGKWMGPRKIFSSLIEKKEKQFLQKIILSTFENLSLSERQKLRASLENKLNKENIKFNYNEEFFTYLCTANEKQIAELSNDTFIDNIRPVTKLVYSETKNEKYSPTPEFTVPIVQLQDSTDWKKDVSPAVDKKTAFYRWYLYKHGYSRELVHKIIKKFGLEQGQKILDPFCGAGTTLLAGSEKGQDVVGYDIMSFPVFASNTKLLRPPVSKIEKYVGEFTISKINSTESSLTTDIKIFGKAFKEDTLKFLFKFRTKINEIKDSEIKAIFLLCYLKTLEKSGKAIKGGGFLRLKKYKRQVPNERILEYFNSYLSEIKEDIENSELTFSGQAKALIGDSRKIKSAQKFDAVISSPPYPNRHDYTRVYLLEEALGFNKNNSAIKKLRYKTLRSHVEAKKQKFKANGYSQPLELKKIVDKLSSEKLNNPQIIEMLEGFFEDMYITLKSIKSKMKKGGKIGFVISNARYSGVPILTDEILLEVGKQAGLTPEEILVLRTRGNSSQQMKEYSREPARESLVIWTV